MVREYYTYILTNKFRTFYVGITNDLSRRLFEHQEKLIPGFTAKYNLSRLVYFEIFSDINDAIAREKQLKDWSRKKKIFLIESVNPHWKDLSSAFLLT